MVAGELIQHRDKVLQYIEGWLVRGLSKKEAYSTYIDGTVKDVGGAIARLERRKEYQDIYVVVMGDENYKLQERAKRVRGKYLGLIEKNIDTADGLLDDVKEGETRDKATAVRLVNETIQAMAVVANPTSPQGGGTESINKAGVIS